MGVGEHILRLHDDDDDDDDDYDDDYDWEGKNLFQRL